MTSPPSGTRPAAGHLRLHDGALVELRRLTAEDYDAVVLLAETLTDRERYLRFFQVHPRSLDEWAHSVTAPSEHTVAMGVFEAGDVIGVANYILTSTPDSAEIAVVVAHQQHERGVGTALLDALGEQASRHGVRRFVADVLAENHLMLKVLSDGDWPCTRHLDGTVFRVEMTLAGAE